jgi:hypothetical protein
MIRTRSNLHRHDWSYGVPAVARVRRRLGVAVFLSFLALTTAACATSPDESSSEPSTSESATAEPTYGDDPMGTARRWAADLTKDADESVPEIARGWSKAVVLRVYRAGDGDFRAVVAESDARHAEAVLLTITRGGGTDSGWSVADARPTDATHGWPTN